MPDRNTAESNLFVCETFQRRADKLRTVSNCILILIIIALIAGLSVYITAGSLTKQDIGYTEERSQMARARDLEDFYRYMMYEAQMRTRNEASLELISSVIESLDHIKRQEPVKMLKVDFKGLIDSKHKEFPAAKKAEIDGFVKDLLATYSDSDSKKAQEKFLLEQLNKSSPREADGYIAIPVLLTRFGGLAVILFLVNILLSLYRYAMRLAAFYDARADALRMMPNWPNLPVDEALFTRFVGSLTPTSIDFGSLPRSPAEQIGALLNRSSP